MSGMSRCYVSIWLFDAMKKPMETITFYQDASDVPYFQSIHMCRLAEKCMSVQTTVFEFDMIKVCNSFTLHFQVSTTKRIWQVGCPKVCRSFKFHSHVSTTMGIWQVGCPQSAELFPTLIALGPSDPQAIPKPGRHSRGQSWAN